eukprot:GHVP01040035.1.p1 GENE.GHVP01040035.1~~GHVP01040035.1.p1  ORF type:complete len:376 (-),score=64.14 GHVP01040035.1:2163-3221(-)
MARTQKNKATANHIGILKAKLAKLRRDLFKPTSSGGGEVGFDVAKTGIARIGFVGFPSVGKSTLMNQITGSFSAVADYEFTTLTTVPGVVFYNGAKLQILDLPGIIEGAKDGKGRGRQVIAVARTCSLIYIVLDAMKPLTHKHIIETELEGFGIRLNKSPPDITIRKRDRGGISISSSHPLTMLTHETIKAILSEYKILNAEIHLRTDATEDELIDIIEGNRIYIPCIYVLNKIDQITIAELDLINRISHTIPVSGVHGWNLDRLLEMTWDYLNFIRIYTKPKAKLPDYTEPVILSQKTRKIENFCKSIHKSLLKDFKYARVWGSSVKHAPQIVGKDHILDDEDIVQIVKRI